MLEIIHVKKIFLLLLISGVFARSSAQPVYNPTGTPYVEAVSGTPSFTDAFACSENPATLPYLKGLATGCYLEKKYLISGLNLADISIVYGKKNSGAGISLKYFGNLAYHEAHASLYYGKNLGDVNIGASFNYGTYSIAGFNRLSVVTLGFFSAWKLSDKFFTSLQMINPPFSRLHNEAVKQKAEYRAGFGYEASPAVCVSLTLQKLEDIPLQVNTSVQYRFGEKFYAKLGVYTAGPQPFVGIGWVLNGFEASFSICYHPVLGVTPGVLFNYQHAGGAALQ